MRGFAACCALAAIACGGERADRPNVILVSIDTLRADALGSYGGAEIITGKRRRAQDRSIRSVSAAPQIPVRRIFAFTTMFSAMDASAES